MQLIEVYIITPFNQARSEQADRTGGLLHIFLFLLTTLPLNGMEILYTLMLDEMLVDQLKLDLELLLSL